jgi:hypothetical protein
MSPSQNTILYVVSHEQVLVFLISQVFVNFSPGLKMVPSGIVSLTRLALAHLDFGPFEGRVGDAGAVNCTKVGENFTGVWVATGAMGAAGVDALAVWTAFWAATVSATAVSILFDSCVAPAVLCAPQAVMKMDVITIVTKSVYFIVLNIFSFRSMGIIILLNRNARQSAGRSVSYLKIDYGQVNEARPNC